MCACDYIEVTTAAEWPDWLEELVPDIPLRWNFPKMEREIVGRSMEGKPQKRMANWGLVPFGTEDWNGFQKRFATYNAKAESLAEGKPTFRSSFERRRCLLIGSAFVEWADRLEGGRKTPLQFQMANEEPFCYAGLWESWGEERRLSCTMITTMPNDLIEPVHSRMPVILEPRDYSTWLDPGTEREELLSLLQPYPSDRMTMREAVLPPRK